MVIGKAPDSSDLQFTYRDYKKTNYACIYNGKIHNLHIYGIYTWIVYINKSTKIRFVILSPKQLVEFVIPIRAS